MATLAAMEVVLPPVALPEALPGLPWLELDAAPTFEVEARILVWPPDVVLTVRLADTPPAATELSASLFIGSADAEASLFLTVVFAYLADLLD